MNPLDVDPARAARAARALREGAVEVTPSGTVGLYRVRSFSGDATYTVRIGEERSCTCPDARFRNTTNCKHVLAALISEAHATTREETSCR